MNTKGIKKVSVTTHSDEWFEFRKNGIGSSEVSAVMGLDPYKLALTLYLEKIGFQEPWKDGNASTYFGTVLEEVVANTWQLYDPTDEESFVKNHKTNNIVRKCRRTNGYIVNERFPYLFSSPDRIIQKGQFRIDDGSINHEEGILEIKTANKFALDKWETAIPPQYVSQVQQQLMVCELDYAEICIFDNFRGIHVYPIEANKEFFGYMEEACSDFWNNRVAPGKVLMEALHVARRDENRKLEEEILAEIDHLAPAPSDGQEELHQDYLKDRYKTSKSDYTILATDDDIYSIKEIARLNELQAKIKNRITAHKNNIMLSMQDNEKMDVGDLKCNVTWRSNKNGTRVLRVDYKDTIENSLADKVDNWFDEMKILD